LGVPLEESVFCGKECFQTFWDTHKLVHKKAKEAAAAAGGTVVRAGGADASTAARAALFENFRFTGRLRPGLVSPQMRVPASVVKPDYADTGRPVSEDKRAGSAVPILTPEELIIMREACAIGRTVLDIAARMLRPGLTCDEIDKAVFAACVERGVYPSPLNYRGFPKSLCTSVNEVICHGIPDDRALVQGDIINLDVSIYHRGFHSDLNETYCVGDVDERGRKLVRTSYDCLSAAIAACRPGVMYRDIGGIIDRVARAAGFSVVKTYTGHGVGRLFHCAPNVPHYKGNKAVGFMRAGHIFTIEPMINEGAHDDISWPDQWTSTTIDGKRSAQFEHTLLVTETGVEVLTARRGGSSTGMVWDAVASQAPFAAGEAPGERHASGTE
jgi:methionyl aminopeptidase